MDAHPLAPAAAPAHLESGSSNAGDPIEQDGVGATLQNTANVDLTEHLLSATSATSAAATTTTVPPSSSASSKTATAALVDSMQVAAANKVTAALQRSTSVVSRSSEHAALPESLHVTHFNPALPTAYSLAQSPVESPHEPPAAPRPRSEVPDPATPAATTAMTTFASPLLQLSPPSDFMDGGAGSSATTFDYKYPDTVYSYTFHDYASPAHFQRGYVLLTPPEPHTPAVLAPIAPMRLRLERNWSLSVEIPQFRDLAALIQDLESIRAQVASGRMTASALPRYYNHHVGHCLSAVTARLPYQEIDEVVHDINALLAEAHEITLRSTLEVVAGILTGWLSESCIPSAYNQAMMHLSEFIQAKNHDLFHPHGLHLRDPNLAAFSFLEIEILDA
ncbi:hypothetical protein RI367_003609 [Sorochytrium milnesiophthora]